MTHGPRYRLSLRRRREGKTNYHRRLRLVLSGKLRLVIRSSINSIIVQVIQANIKGDKILVNAHSKQLIKNFEWNYYTGNMPSAYLTGYLCGIRAKKAGIEECILDLGVVVHKNRILAAFKGFIDSGVNVPYGEKIFQKANIEERSSGAHIKAYAEFLAKNDKKLYEQKFSSYIKNKVDPKKIPEDFEKVKKLIEKL